MNLTRFIRRYPPLSGGLFLPAPTTDPGHRDFRPLPKTESDDREPLRVALCQATEPCSTPTVAPGNRVTMGQPIAMGTAGGRVHAPASGQVRGLVSISTPYSANVPAIEFDADDPFAPADIAPAADGAAMDACASRDMLLSAIDESGVMRSSLFDVAPEVRPDTLIINGLEPSPYQSATTQMLFKYRESIIASAARIHELFGIRRTYLVADRAQRKLVRILERHARGCQVRVIALVNKYPQSLAPLLIKTVLKREIPHGRRASDIGVVVLEAATIVDIARALLDSVPVTHRMVTVSGPVVRRPGNYTVPLGTSLRSIARAVGAGGWRRMAVVDNPLAGPGIRDESTVITKRTSSIYFIDDGLQPVVSPTGCVRSGACVNACPVRLDPRALLGAAERRRFDLAAPLFPGACVDCGLCNYVCPSALPLMQGVQECRSRVYGK